MKWDCYKVLLPIWPCGFRSSPYNFGTNGSDYGVIKKHGGDALHYLENCLGLIWDYVSFDFIDLCRDMGH